MVARLLNKHWKQMKKLLDVKKESEQAGRYREARRIHAVVLNMEGQTSMEIAKVLKASRQKVSLWLKDYEQEGLEALQEGERPGRPSRLGERQIVELTDIVDSGPVSYGFLSGVWTCPMMARIIDEEFEIQYHPDHVGRILHRLGFSVQRPKRSLIRANAEKRNRWIRLIYPAIKKKPNGRKPL